MAIYHDAYLLDLTQLQSTVLSHLTETKTLKLDNVSAEILDLFASNQHFCNLTANYGGWDKIFFEKELLEGFLSTNVLMTMIVYGQIASHDNFRDIGLGHKYLPLANILKSFKWQDEKINKLIYGRNFLEYAQSYLNIDTNSPSNDYWHKLSPDSTASTIGWLDDADITALLENLRSINLHLADSNIPIDEITDSIDTAIYMLDQAMNSKNGLCLITSG